MLQNTYRHLPLKTIKVYNTSHREKGSIPYLVRGLQSVSRVGGVNAFSKIIKL